MPHVTPKLIAFGGFSGSGKSLIGMMTSESVGAEIVEIDRIWKAELNIAATDAAPAGSYTPERHKKVLAAFDDLTRTALQNGKDVIAQKIFARPEEREAIEKIANDAGAEFFGIWLDVPVEILKKRVLKRENSVSDAPVTAIDRQLSLDQGHMNWLRINGDREPEVVLRDVLHYVAARAQTH